MDGIVRSDAAARSGGTKGSRTWRQRRWRGGSSILRRAGRLPPSDGRRRAHRVIFV